MKLIWDDSIWELMLTKRPSDTHFSQSRTPGGKSPLVRNDENALNTHAVLFDGKLAVLGIFAAGVAVGAVVAVKTAPHVKNGLTSLKSKLVRQAEETTDAEVLVSLEAVSEVESEEPDPHRLRAV